MTEDLKKKINDLFRQMAADNEAWRQRKLASMTKEEKSQAFSTPTPERFKANPND